MDAEKDTAATVPLAFPSGGHPEKAEVGNKKKMSAVKFFLCFHGDDVALQRVVPVGSSSMVTPDSELEVERCSNQQRKPERHGFFHALKAMLFKMLLVKKIQQRKSDTTFANERAAITSGTTQEWSDHKDVPKMVTVKTTSAGGSPVFAYVKEKEEVVFPSMLSSLPKNEKTCQDQWLNKGRHRLSHILKAVLFETALARKIQASKIGKKNGPNGRIRSNTEELCDDDRGKITQSASSLTNSSVFTSSTMASTTISSAVSRSTSNSRSLSDRIRSFRSISSNNIKSNLKNLSEKIRSNSKSNSRNKISLESINSNGLREEHHAHFADEVTQTEKKKKKARCYRSASGLCFLLMSLLGLILFGKLGGILCTSMWLVCIPLFSLGDHKSSTNKVVIEKKEVTRDGGMLAGITRTRTQIIQSQ